MFKEISLKEFVDQYNIFDFNLDWGVASCKNSKEKNCLTVSWASFGYLWSKPTLTIYINKQRFSEHIFSNGDYFTLSIFDKNEYRKELMYLGRTSGRNEDKFIGSKLSVIEEDEFIYFGEAKYVIFVKKMGQTKFDIDNIKLNNILSWYKKDGGHTIYEGEIIKILKNS